MARERTEWEIAADHLALALVNLVHWYVPTADKMQDREKAYAASAKEALIAYQQTKKRFDGFLPDNRVT